MPTEQDKKVAALEGHINELFTTLKQFNDIMKIQLDTIQNLRRRVSELEKKVFISEPPKEQQ